MSTRTSRVVWDLVARDRASRTFGKVGQSATRLSRQGAGIGGALAAGFKAGGVAAAGLGFNVLKVSGDFEKSMNQVRAVSGATGKDFQDLRDQAKNLGATTKFTASEAAQGMGFLAMAGFRAHDILNAMPGVLSLASAGNMDLARSADIASNILTGYGFKTTETTRVVDVMAKTFTSTNTNLEQLGEAFKYAGPVAHAAGVKFEESAAAIGLMGNAGIQASMAGTSLRGAISRLLSPTKQIKNKLTELGITVKDSRGKLLPLKDIIDQLAKSGADTGDMMTLFGQRAGPAMLALVEQGSGALVKLTGELEKSGGTADKIAKIQMEGLNGQLVSLKSAWEGLMIEIGDLGVLKLATKGVEGITNVTRGFTDYLSTDGLPILKQLGQRFGAMVPVDKLKAALKDAGGVVGDFFKGLVGGAPAKLPTPMLKAPEVPKFLQRPKSDAESFGETVRKVGVQLAKDLKPLAEAGLGISKAFIGIVTHTPAPVFTAMVDVMIATSITKRVIELGAAFRGLALAMSASWAAATGPIGVAAIGVWGLAWAFSAASGNGTGLGDTLRFLKDAIVGPYGIAGALTAIADGFVWTFSRNGGLAQHIGDFNDWLAEQGGHLIDGFMSGVTGAWNSVVKWFSEDLPNAVIRWVRAGFGIASPARVMMPLGADVIRGFLSGALGVASGIGSWIIDNVKTPTLGAFSKVGSWLTDKGGSLISGLVSGTWGWLAKKGNDFKTWAGKIKGQIISAIVDVFKIGSPSRVMMEYGGHIMAGLQKGMLQSGDALKSVAKTLFKSPLDAAKNMFSNGVSIGSEWLAKVGGAIGLGDSSATGSAQQFAQLAMKSFGWGPSQWPALKALWQGESGWNYKATNPSSGAYGIPQALPASKMASAGSDWRTNPATQIKWGLDYIRSRYGSPTAAWSFWQRQSPHWYDNGGYLPTGASLVMNGTGRKEPTAVFTQQQWDTLHALAASGGATEVRVFIGDRELTDIVRTETRPLIRASEDRTAFRAKVGRR